VHLVLYTPKPELRAEEIAAFARAIQEAVRKIPDIRRALIGPAIHVTPGYSRPANANYTYAATLEFDDVAALGRYLEHPLHRELGRLFWQFCEDAIVVEAEMTDVLIEDLKT
jgi:hypothetical protein